jgi:hypothetical protein
MEHGKHRN